jgi:protein SCO1/2
VCKSAALLSIQYRLLADGECNHTTALILLDADGCVVGCTKKIGMVDSDFVKLIHQTLQQKKSAK